MNDIIKSNSSFFRNFYTVGGAVDPTALSYIVRSADNELLEGIMQGEFCYVLTSRQLGKSSLVAYTRRKLRDREFATSVIDLGLIGQENISESEWYLGQIVGLLKDLGIDIKENLGINGGLQEWWDQTRLGAVQRYFNFISDVLLKCISKPIVVFIDEIDATLKLSYSDSFFAGIRGLYNQRALDPIYKRITFVLLGVASPGDLIKEPQHTPFNIGRRIHLTDFTFAEAEPLAKGLGLDEASNLQLLHQILRWTNGHPYLTQKVCQLVSDRILIERKDWVKENPETLVKEVVEEELLSSKGNDDYNLSGIRRSLLNYVNNGPVTSGSKQELTSLSLEMLRLYYQIRHGERVYDEALSPSFSLLKLSGIVVSDVNGSLNIRNEIYRHFFNEKWLLNFLSFGGKVFGESKLNLQFSNSTLSPTRLRVFIASPNDVLDARRVLEEVIDDLNFSWGKRSGMLLELLDWRTHITPYLDKPPQTTLINQLPIETWDLFIGILWSRFGTPIHEINPDTGQRYLSGTEHEFNMAYKWHKSLGKPKILFYRCTKPVNPDVDSKQLTLVQEFFKQFQIDGQHHGLYASYESLDEFRRNIYRHLIDALLDFQQGVSSQQMVGESSQGIQVWLNHVNLLGNPFKNSNAGLDDKLQYYHHYLSIANFSEIIGNTNDPPQSYIIVGEPGMGKTALFQIITHFSRQRPGGRNVLCIPYTDFTSLLEKLTNKGTIQPRDHVDQIIVSGLKSLSIALNAKMSRLNQNSSDEERNEFSRYFRYYQHKLHEDERKLITDSLGNDLANNEKTEFESYIDLFYGFCRSVRIYGYDIVYILLDQLDESGIADEQKIVDLLVPLVGDLQLMEPPNELAVFRIFLPARIETLLKEG